MRHLLVSASIVLLVTSPTAADLLTPEEAKWVRACMERLDANAPRVRKSAEQALVGMGRVILPAVVANLKRVKGRTAEAGLQRVLLALGRSAVLQDLTRMAGAARAGERKRIEDLMDRLGDALGVGEPLTVQLDAETLIAWDEVPHAAEHSLASWPTALLPGGGTTKIQGDTIEIRPTGGAPHTLTRGERRVLRVPVPGRRTPAPVLVYEKLGRWFAASASLRRGTVRRLTVEFWDVDLDRRFDGSRDMARVPPGAWQVLLPSKTLVHQDHVVAVELAAPDAAGPRVKVTVQPPPDAWAPDHVDFMGALHRWRARHGLGPLIYDRKRSRGCTEHARYLVRNNDVQGATSGGASHHQDPSLPGATEAGAEAAISSVLLSAGMDDLVVRTAVTMLHRIAWLAPTGTLIGVGGARQARVAWSGSWTERGGPETDPRLITVPAPGAKGVRSQGGDEWPAPDAPAKWYDAPRGYPISATYAHLGWTKPRLALFTLDGTGEPRPVAGQMWSPEQPIAATHRGNRGTAFFMAARPLERNVVHWAVFEADSSAGPQHFAWTFTPR